MEITTKVIKIKLNPTKEQQEIIVDSMVAYMTACNFVSEYIYNTKNLNQFSLNKELYHKIRERYALRSQMAQSALKTVIAKYKTIKETTKDWIKPHFSTPQIDLVWSNDYTLKDEYFSLNTLEGRLKVGYTKNGFEKYFNKDLYKFGTAKLVLKTDKLFLHIPVSYNVESSELSDIVNVVGIDRGINFIATSYDSKGTTHFFNGKKIKAKRIHYKKLRSELQKKRTKSAKRRLKVIGRRENRWMTDVNHQVSKALINQNPKHTLFVLEDLKGIRKTLEKHRKENRYVSVSWAFYQLEQFLMYKAKENQCSVIKVKPHYTSQCCPKCGHTDKSNRDKNLHRFCCKNCNYQSNDDRIGAMNLYRKGVEYINTHTGVAE